MNSLIKQGQSLSTMKQKIDGFLQEEISVGISEQTFRQKFVFNQNSGPDAIYVDVKTLSPSQIQGMTKKQQNTCLQMMSEMLFKAGQMLKLPISTTIVALNISQYYYTRKSLFELDLRDLSMGAMFLACKSEETLRRSYQIAAVFDYIFKTYEGQRNIKELQLNSLEYNYIKQKVTKTENQILFQLGFEVSKLFDIPHRYISGLLSSFNKHKDCNLIVQHSWNFLNDIYRTKCPIYFPGQVIAAAAVFMALKKLSIPLPQKPWWILMESSLNEIKQISFIIQKMIESSKKNEVNINKISDILQKVGKQSLKIANVFPVPYYRKIWLEGQGLLMKRQQQQIKIMPKQITQQLSSQQEDEEKDDHKERSKKQKKRNKKQHKSHKNKDRSRSKSSQRQKIIMKGKYQNDDETPKLKNQQNATAEVRKENQSNEYQILKAKQKSEENLVSSLTASKQLNPVKKSVLLDAKSMLSKISLHLKKIEQKNETVLNTSKVEEISVSQKVQSQYSIIKTQNLVSSKFNSKEKQIQMKQEGEQSSSDEEDDQLLADLIKIKRKNLEKKEQ